MWRRNGLSIIALALAAMHAWSAAPSRNLNDFKSVYEKEREKILADNAETLRADAAYRKQLDAAEAEFKKAGDFDNTVAILDEKKRFDACKMVPPQPATNTPPSIVRFQASYLAALSKAESEKNERLLKLMRNYVNALTQHIKTQLEANKMEDARLANEERKRVSTELEKLGLAPPPPPETASSSESAGRTAPPAGGTAAASRLPRGLIVHYGFSADERRKVSDLSRNGNEGRIEGGQWTIRGRIGGGFEADGSGDYVEANVEGLPAGNDDRTFAVWFKTEQDKGQTCLMSSGAPEQGNAFGLILQDGRLMFSAWLNDFKGGPDLSDGRWHHGAIVHDASGNQRLYLDGEEVATHASRLHTGRGPLRIGRWLNAIIDFRGTLDEIMVFDRALSAEEIRQIYRLAK